ncbi:hypothetical protein EJ02DRAFT_88587 [Clathrospora elynae]|uniref:Extracellular membrane protein CFEM domain-containing protein n=1 Tax=Clathrospora elynae TaxID=706981 RepID=A0A6A5T9F5_9PLEO|nr:hypothetical protein EJ02DRAFT_88587 [Clathrospora elynae]
MTQSSWSLLTLALAMTILPHARAEGETSIWIDEIPLYTQLAACAQDRISAIVRAQSSGCNDDSAHTSFACFCIQQSSKFSSIISTAVAQQCSRLATQVTTSGTVDRRAAHITSVADRRGAVVRQAIATTTGVAENVSSALEVFESYCAKSTDISLCKSTIERFLEVTNEYSISRTYINKCASDDGRDSHPSSANHYSCSSTDL